MVDKRLKTGISKVRWCDPADGFYNYDPAVMPGIMIDDDAREMCWLDELFHGGIKLLEKPHGKDQALTLLITGPPGTGKSTLAFETCISLVTRLENKQVLTGRDEWGKILYVASEAQPEWMIDNAEAFGWLDRISPQARQDISAVGEFRDKAKLIFDLTLNPKPGQIAICSLSDAVHREGSFFETLGKMLGLDSPKGTRAGNDIPGLDVVVIDSLNTVGPDKAKAYEQFYGAFVASGPKLMIFVLDSTQAPSVAEAWEFGADIVVRLDKDSSSGYLVRTLEIVKARYQSHVWGKNNLKIREHPPRVDHPGEKPVGNELEKRQRAHPWMEGGLFIFPSIHFILSRFKRGGSWPLHEQADNIPHQKAIETPLPSLTTMLGGGIPAGYTTALLGSRGGHKSHLGHLQALYNVKKLEGRSIIVSLRDGERIVMEQLKNYIHDEGWDDAGAGADQVLDVFLKSGKLEILTYMPGYVTPEEFFHRILLSIFRMRASDPEHDIVLIFNSLDQIASRFPLCAKERVFIPGIIQTLSSLGVTSIFIGADEEVNVDDSIPNLLSMAELIIRMKRTKLSSERIKQVLENAEPPVNRRAPAYDDLSRTEGEVSITRLTVERYAGGRNAGLQGMLELVTDKSLFHQILAPGLQFIPYRKI